MDRLTSGHAYGHPSDQWTRCTVPSRPLSRTDRTQRADGKSRRTCAGIATAPPSAAAARTCPHCSIVSASGFSTSTCLPARSRVAATLACASCAVATMAASMFGSTAPRSSQISTSSLVDALCSARSVQ